MPNFAYAASTRTWDGEGTTELCGEGNENNWSCASNWSDDTVPITGDTVLFNNTSDDDSIVDVGFNLTEDISVIFNMASGYDGTVTLARSLTTTTFTQASGIFTAADQTLDINSTFTLSAGAFTASSGTTSLAGAMTVSGTPTFDHNSGTFTFDGTGNKTLSCNDIEFNLVTFANTANTITVSSNCDLPLGEDPTIEAAGSITLNGTLSGSGTLTKSAGTLTLGSTYDISDFTGLSAYALTINGGADADFSSYNPVDINSTFTLNNGSFTAPLGTMTVAGAFTLTDADFVHNGGTLTFDGTSSATLSCNSVEFDTVTFAHTSGTKTISSNCDLPLGSNPSTSVGEITNNGTITASGTWTVNGKLTNGATGVIALTGSTINFKKDFTQSGTFDLTDKTINFNGSGSILTCTGDLGGTVNITLTGGSFVNGTGCNISLGASPTTVVGEHLTNNGTMTVSSGSWNMSALTDSATALATLSDMGADLTGTRKWSKGVLGSDGKIYGMPANSTDILIIDPAAGTATRSDMGADLTGTSKWLDGFLASDGKIYGVPQTATDILIIDPSTGTATRSNMGADLSGSGKWWGGGFASDGKIYGMPHDSTDILIIDPSTGTATRSDMGADLTGSTKWVGGVLGSDGKIYGVPWSSTDILIIDPSTDTATRSNMGAVLTGSNGWSNGVLGSDGKVYFMPRNSTDILIIDPSTDTATGSNMGADLAGGDKWASGGLGSDDKIYGIPRGATDILIIDPSTGTATRSNLGVDLTGSDKWYGNGAVYDGKVYFMPRDATDILIIDLSAKPTLTNTGTINHNGTAWTTDMSINNSGTIVFDGILTLNGTVAQELTCGGATLTNLTITNPTTVTFEDNCAISDTLHNHTPDSILTFNAGSTYAIGRLSLEGANKQPVQLTSSQSGSAWQLNLSESDSTIIYASIADSNASPGKTAVVTRNAYDNGGNTNWIFSQSGGGGSALPSLGNSLPYSPLNPSVSTESEEETSLEEPLEVKTEESKNLELENRAFQDLAKSIPQVLDESGPVKEAISSFIAYGTPSTEKLGSGERSGVIQSFVSAFNKLPQTEEDWNDIYKIATGYWPSQTSSQKEEQSKGFFETIYLRQPNANITQDQVAIDVMSYGIRPKNRNLDSEQTAIGYFISIFRKIPIIAIDWDIIRAIAYSGAKR